MKKFVHRNRIEKHSPKINHLISHRIRIKLYPNRILHPAVCHQNPQSGEIGTNGNQPTRSKVESLAYPVPTEKHYSNKGTFHKESHYSFNGKRSSENVSYKPRVITPVGSEFKFQNNSGGNTNGKVDPEKLHPKFGDLFPFFVLCLHINGFHNGNHKCSSQCKRNKKPVVHCCKSKLCSGPIDEFPVYMIHKIVIFLFFDFCKILLKIFHSLFVIFKLGF